MLFKVVFDRFSFDEIDHIFADIGRMVSDSLQVSSNQDKVYSSFNRGVILHHIGYREKRDSSIWSKNINSNENLSVFYLSLLDRAFPADGSRWFGLEFDGFYFQ